MKPVRNVTPDKLDLRDRPYLPAVALAPPPRLGPRRRAPVLDQGSSSACTGFALATVVNRLLAASGRGRETPVSPWMLYSMARRYDEFPGASEAAGSSLRGALKGWFKHGACAAKLWSGPEMPQPARRAADDWWQDAVNRPLGAYYRVDFRSVTDMHVALNETGVLYASAVAHRGWLAGERSHGKGFTIPHLPRAPEDGGHAFAIVGYDRDGFLVHNSWGARWGDGGFATLLYEDWLENAMDCWVAQIGVVTAEHRRVAASAPGAARARRALSPDKLLRNHELAPHVIDMENDGRLSGSGAFRTTPDDVRALAGEYLDRACRDGVLVDGEPVDIALYVHGGLVDEAEAAGTFARWMPALLAARRFPVFLMWESDVLSQLRDRLADLLEEAARPVARPLEALQAWWDERIEGLVAPVGTLLWDEMKKNAAAISGADDAGARMFFAALARSPVAARHPPRLHLVGHSAGSIALAYLVDRIAAQEWDFESVAFLAPAIRVDAFEERVLPWLEAGRIGRFVEYHLTDAAELRDPSMRALAGYSRSLLFLVSRAFEGHAVTPILGMQRWFPPALERMKRVSVVTAPSESSSVATHSGFTEDPATMASVIAAMQAARKRP
jgi:hypothetical protein